MIKLVAFHQWRTYVTSAGDCVHANAGAYVEAYVVYAKEVWREMQVPSHPIHFPDFLRTSQATKDSGPLVVPLCAIHKQLAKIVGTWLPGLEEGNRYVGV